ncbi:Glutathione S-transferase F8, chloroplastic [Linum grandiflorum]
MAGIKVYGSPFSTATQRVIATLYEKEVEFEFVKVDMAKGEHKQESFLALNPFGQVPAYQEGDVTLFESRAITHYIAEKYSSNGTQLIVADPQFKVWEQVELNKFDPASSPLAWEQAFKPMFGMTTDPAAVEANETKLTQVLDVYEARLSKSKYLGGDQFSLVDLHHLPNIQVLQGTPSKKLFDSHPKVAAWIADISGRPAWTKVLDLQKQ